MFRGIYRALGWTRHPGIRLRTTFDYPSFTEPGVPTDQQSFGEVDALLF